MPRLPFRSMFSSLTVALAAWGCGSEAADEPAPPPRHFVLISIDTLRADRLGSYGHDRDTSPNLDAFAERSLVFTDASASASNTAPSHMSMFTGLAPPVHGVFNVQFKQGKPVAATLLSPAMTTIAEHLQQAGFATAAFTDGGYLTPEMQFDRGFEHFDRRPESAAAKVDRALAWLEQQDPSQPMFLFVHTYEVHAPYLPPLEHDLYTDADYAGPLRAVVDQMRALKGHVGPRLAGSFLPKPGEVGPDDVRFLSDLYDGGVHSTDQAIGRLLDALDGPRWGDDTAVLVLSDHGEALGEHDDLDHAALFRSVTHVPFVLHVPGGPVGRRDAPVSGVDVLPTVLDVLGLPAPDLCDGSSVLGTLPPDRPLVAYNDNPATGGGTSLRVGSDQLVRHWSGLPWVHFDLAADPGQGAPLPADQGTGARLVDLVGEMAARQEQVGQLLGRGLEGDAELSAETLRQLEALGYLGDH